MYTRRKRRRIEEKNGKRWDLKDRTERKAGKCRLKGEEMKPAGEKEAPGKQRDKVLKNYKDDHNTK